MVRGLRRLSEYLGYGALALGAGVPPAQLPTVRRAVNLIDALGRMDLTAPVRIVDVGANRGEWGAVCAKLFRRGEILSFEPVGEYHQAAARLAAGFRNWQVLRMAVGEGPGRVPIEVRGERSSFKRLGGLDFADWAESTPASGGVETVEVDSLDRILGQREFYPVDLLKIDAEGYEREILRGATETLDRTRQVLIEVRFYELFEGGPLFHEVHEMLTAHRFVLEHLKPCKGTCLWADATYARTGSR
jgi:FkbM family methyltransferase